MKEKVKATIHGLAIVFFGVIFPSMILISAYQGINELQEDIQTHDNTAKLIEEVKTAKNALTTSKEYTLFSMMFIENSNKETMVNKQQMKVVVMMIGFAVISIGIMFIILGIKEVGAEVSADVGGIQFDFKTGSAGVAIFLMGSLMVTIGGILKNKYATVGIPDYRQIVYSVDQKDKGYSIKDAKQKCEAIKHKGKKEYEQCLKKYLQK